MPALINAAANLMFGSLVARATYDPAAPREGVMTWPLVMLIVFHSLVLVPAGSFLFRFYPDWSTHYAFDPRVFVELKQWLGTLAFASVALNLLMAVLGYSCGLWGMHRGKSISQHAGLIVGAVVIVGALSQFWQRVVWVGGYDAYWQREAKLLLNHPAGWVGLSAYVAAFVFFRWLKKRHGIK